MPLTEELEKQGSFLFRYRSHLPLLLLVCGLLVRYLEGARSVKLTTILELVALVVGLLGLAVRSHVIGYAPRYTSGRNTSDGQVAGRLTTDGWYSVVRNPLYLGNYLMWLAPAILTGNVYFVLLFTTIFFLYYERIIFAEEVHLRTKFGPEYDTWALQTPMLIPGGLPGLPSDRSFNVRKVVRQEINGLLALAVTFLLFSFLDRTLIEQRVAEPGTFAVVFGTAAIALFFFVRALRTWSPAMRKA